MIYGSIGGITGEKKQKFTHSTLFEMGRRKKTVNTPNGKIPKKSEIYQLL